MQWRCGAHDIVCASGSWALSTATATHHILIPQRLAASTCRRSARHTRYISYHAHTHNIMTPYAYRPCITNSIVFEHPLVRKS